MAGPKLLANPLSRQCKFKSLDRARPIQRVLLAVSEDDLCLWFWQDITHAGGRPMVAESVVDACDALRIETDIRLVITNATPREGSEVLVRTATAKGIPYLIARLYRQGVRLMHKDGIGFEGDPSAMGDFLAEILRRGTTSSWPREAK
jgi:hypothetical protein